jgi:hypothetical protein
MSAEREKGARLASSKKRQTFAKIAREQAVRERRARKQAKKDQRREPAAPEQASGTDVTSPALIDEAEVRRLSRQR